MAEKVLALQGVPLPDGGPLDASLRAGETRRVTGSARRLEAAVAVVSGLRAPDAGRVLLLGRLFSTMRDEDRRVLRATSIGVAATAWPLLDWLSVSENVRLGIPEDGDDAVEATLDAFGLAPLRDAAVSDLDPTIRVESALLARALAKKPPLLVWQPAPSLQEADVLSLLQRSRSVAGSRLAVLLLLDDARSLAADDALTEQEPSSVADATDAQFIEVPANLRSR